MPCRGPESDTFTRSEVENKIAAAVAKTLAENNPALVNRRRLEAQAGPLIEWLEAQEFIQTDGSDTAKLCGMIRSMDEVDFLTYLLNNALNSPEARQLIGWWEEHKRIDEVDRGL